MVQTASFFIGATPNQQSISSGQDCVLQLILIKLMERCNNSSPRIQQQEKSNKQEPVHPLPAIEPRKFSVQIDDPQRYPQKQARPLFHQEAEESEKSSKQPIFSVPKDTNFFKKRIYASPNKIMNRQKLYDTLQSELLKRQIDELRTIQQEGFCKEQLFLASAIKEFALTEDTSNAFKPASVKPLSHPYRKRSSANQHDKLTPITSETHIKKGELQFFNVEKMMLLEGSRNKKSQSLIVQGQERKERSPLHRNKTRMIKDLHELRLKLQRGTVLAGEERGSFKEQGFDMNIRTIDVKADGLRELLNSSYRKKTEPLHEEESEVRREKVLHITLREERTGLVKFGKAVRSENKVEKLEKLEKMERIEKAEKAEKVEKCSEPDKTIECNPDKLTISPTRRLPKKFTTPFQTYHYRDLIWKVNFTNNLYVQSPLQYEHRLKVYVGKGNNSCMVSGLISRRPWFAFTDKIQQANFVWTQLKKLQFFKKQNSFKETIVQIQGKYQEDSILTDTDSLRFKTYFKTYLTSEQHGDQRMLSRAKNLKYSAFIKSSQIRQGRMHNHLINNYVLGNKKALFNTMANYYRERKKDVFDYLPLTFHIKEGLEDKRYFQFLRYYHKRAKEIKIQEKGRQKEYNAWIVKPGENSNRGNGIKMCLTLEEIKTILKKRDRYPDGSFRTHIVQAYIERPLLYFKRKFDLRHYIMMTCTKGIVKGYWYKYGYVRTTSSEYSLHSSNGGIHLTNDAVQKNLPDYGKYEKGNKISYDELAAYIEKYHKVKGLGFYESIYPRMKSLAADAMRACSGGIDPKKLEDNFEVFGMDFMIDAKLDVWLIEINTNPCLELSCPLLGCIIPKMVENALQLTLDSHFPPPQRFSPKGMHYFKDLEKQNKFQLVYDERIEPLCSGSLQVLDDKLLAEEDDTFQDCGDDWQDQ